METLIEQVKNGHRRAIAQLITQVENEESAAIPAIAALFASTGKAHIVGVTGPPGSGKSTVVNEITKVIRQRKLQVGIIAVDPSSPFTGGALLGDRVRMRDLSGDKGIFVRSMASRGSLGGLARTTGDIVKILDAAGFQVILIETVGAGQAEVDVASTAHTTLVIETPGMGDEIQIIKAGILEIADILVVNKADRTGSDKTVRALKAMIHMGASSTRQRHHGRMMMVPSHETSSDDQNESWTVPVESTVAIEGKGIDNLVERITQHEAYLRRSGEWLEREKARSRQEIGLLLQARFMVRMMEVIPPLETERLITAVAERRIDPYSAVDQLFAQAGAKG